MSAVAPSGRDEATATMGIAADAMGPRTGASSSSSAPKKQSNPIFANEEEKKRMVAQALKRKRDAMKKSNKPTKGNANKSNGGNNGGISGDPPKLKPPTILPRSLRTKYSGARSAVSTGKGASSVSKARR